MAQTFVSQLPTVPKADVVHGDKCLICHETYDSEDAVRLPCGHEFGLECLRIWLSPTHRKNSCPLCRHELFPAIPQGEAGSEPPADDTEADWSDPAPEVDSELSAYGVVHRSRPFSDWLMYSQLQHQGADLPPWRPGGANPGPRLDATQEEALVAELRRRGAFGALPVPVGSGVSEREMWTVLRDGGWAYDPVYAATSGGCAWSRV